MTPIVAAVIPTSLLRRVAPRAAMAAGYPPRARLRLRGGRDRAGARKRLGHVLVRVVARAHERAGRDVLEAERVRRALQRQELLGVPVADDGEVALGGPQVLADGEHLHALLAQLAE